MNYWLLTTEYPPFYGGGIGTYCHFTAKMFAEAGNSITVFISDDSIRDHSITEIQAGITIIRFNSDSKSLGGSLGYTARLSYAFAGIVEKMIAERGRPDYIEAQDYLGIAYYLTQYKHLGYEFIKDIPILITLHSPAFVYLEYNRVPTYRFPDFWTCEMEKHSIRAADLLLSPTVYIKSEIEKFVDLSEKRIEILANPYDRAKPPGYPPPFQRGKIVYYGKLSPQKGSFELLEYFRELWENGFSLPLHIIGGTDIVFHPEFRTMGQIVEEKYGVYIKKGLLQLHGKIRPDQIADHLSDAHVILVPSIVDNMPYVVMEAMSLGKTVLASEQGGQREMIRDGVDGFLFDHSKPGSFSSRLQKILALSDEAIGEIAKNAMFSVSRTYSPQVVYPQKEAILANLSFSDKDLFPFLYQENYTLPSPQDSSSETLLSIVIPYYNMGDYIEECLNSVKTSSYRDIKILIINDGSTDQKSIALLRKIVADDPQISVFDQPNKGLAFTRNAGAAMAKGRYLAFLDADDKVEETYYAKAIAVLKSKKNVFFAGSWVRYFENSHQVWPTFTPQPPYILAHNSVNSSGLVYKREAFLRGGLNDKAVGYGLEDYESVINMLHNGLNGVILPETLFHYRVRSGSMIRDISREKLLYSNKYITEKHSAYYAKFAPQIINILNANGPGYLFDNPTHSIKVISNPEKTSRLFIKLKMLLKRNERLKKAVLLIKNKLN